MQQTLPRRSFFVTAGLMAGGAVAAPLSPLALAQSRKPPQRDPVVDHIGREMARLYKRQRTGPFYSEHYDTLAANLRLLAISYPDIREAAKKPLRHEHNRRAERVEEVRKHLGLDVSGEPLPALVPDGEAEKIRRQFAKEGLVPTFLQMAALAEARGRDVARNGNRPEFRTVQGSLPWSPWCSYGPRIEVAVTITCSIIAPGAVLGGVITAGAGYTVCAVATVTNIVWGWWC